LLGSLDDPEKLMGAILEDALLRAGAVRGIIFDRERIVRSVGYSHNDKVRVWHTLERLLLESNSVMLSGEPLFDGLALDQDEPAFGVAGTLTGRSANLAVLAIEKETQFEQSEVDDFADWVQLTSKPVDVALSFARWNPATHGQPLRLRDLPLEDLNQVPNLAEVERLLISVAMNRNQNNRGKAAAALGISREGLRRKLLRGYV
jgi:hypothetical protein